MRVFMLSENGCVEHWAAAEAVHEAMRFFADAIRDQGSDIDNPEETITVSVLPSKRWSDIAWS
ncbi:hypothetical protein LCGC14_2977040, partial [marine sediment metagenome]